MDQGYKVHKMALVGARAKHRSGRGAAANESTGNYKQKTRDQSEQTLVRDRTQ